MAGCDCRHHGGVCYAFVNGCVRAIFRQDGGGFWEVTGGRVPSFSILCAGRPQADAVGNAEGARIPPDKVLKRPARETRNWRKAFTLVRFHTHPAQL